MLEYDFFRVIKLIRDGGGADTLQRVVQIAASLLDSPYAFIVARTPEGLHQIASTGTGLWQSWQNGASKYVTTDMSNVVVVEDVQSHAVLNKKYSIGPINDARFLVNIPLRLQGLPFPVTLNVVDNRIGNGRGFDALPQLIDLASIAVEHLRMLAVLSLPSENRLQEDHANYEMFNEEKATAVESKLDIVSEFLLKTLIERRHLRERKGLTYIATTTWRAGVKDAQILALRALKRNPPESLVDDVARLMVRGVGAVSGGQAHRAVVPVPCGHTGPDCLSRQLAERVASLLKIEFVDAFLCENRTGSSHPASSIRMKPPRLKATELTGPVILVDDVATTGTHLSHAATALRSITSGVLPIVWIAG